MGYLAIGIGENIYGIAFSDDGKLAATDHSINIRLWQVATSKQLWKTSRKRGSSLAFSRDGKVLLAGNWEEGLVAWDVATGKQLRRIAPPATGREKFVAYYGLAFSPNGKILAAIRASAIQLWDWPSGKELRRLEADPKDHALSAAVFSPDGRVVMASGQGGHMRLWDVASGRLLHTLKPSDARPHNELFSPDGRLLHYTFLKNIPHTPPPINVPWLNPTPSWAVIEVCELASGRIVLHIEQKTINAVNRLLTSPDGRLLALLTSKRGQKGDAPGNFHLGRAHRQAHAAPEDPWSALVLFAR